MNKRTYIKKLSCMVRWRLPKKEADEVLSDYEEMLLHRGENGDDTLIQEFGDPFQAARMLTEPKTYRCWLAVFGVMTLCLLFPEIMLLRVSFWEQMLPCFLVVGAAVSLVWFRPCRGMKKSPMPKSLLLILAVLLLAVLAAGGMVWGIAIHAWEWIPPERYGFAARWLLLIVGSAGSAAAFGGLIQSRLSDYRWRALYIMGLTVLIECAIVMALLTRMDPNGAYGWVPYTVRFSITGILGLMLTGVSLC